jgi:RNA polymerase sigma-70 factor, ECF subfamily
LFFNILLADLKNADSNHEKFLIERIVLRNEKSLEELYDRYSRIIFSLALRIVKKKEDAEEILQNVFLQIWDKAHTFDYQKGNVYSWIITLTRNKAIDKLRSKSYKTESQNVTIKEDLLTFTNASYNSTIDAVTMNERISIVKNAISQIPEEQKSIIELAYFEGYTQAEISETLNIPLGTVKTRMRQAMIKLRTILSDYL